MLTEKQYNLLIYLHEQHREKGVCPSYEDIRHAVGLKSKSGVHALVKALVERGYCRRLPNRARAIEVLKLPESATPAAPPLGRTTFRPALVVEQGVANRDAPANDTIPVLGRIAAGVPIEAIQNETHRIAPPEQGMSGDQHFALEVRGDSMIDAGILDGDIVVLRRGDTANSGDIVVALIDEEEATLKRLRKRGKTIALEAANPDYETRIFGPDKVRVQGKLVALVRRYN